MRILAAVIGISLLGAASVDAANWFRGRKLPRPLDSPIVRKNVKEHHKPGKKQRHPPGPSPFTWKQPAAPIALA